MVTLMSWSLTSTAKCEEMLDTTKTEKREINNIKKEICPKENLGSTRAAHESEKACYENKQGSGLRAKLDRTIAENRIKDNNTKSSSENSKSGSSSSSSQSKDSSKSNSSTGKSSSSTSSKTSQSTDNCSKCEKSASGLRNLPQYHH